MNNGLEHRFEKIEIEVYTGTGRIQREGEFIAGEWASAASVRRIDKARPIALDLLNAPHAGKKNYADAALSFTKKFGPLTSPFSQGAAFSFTTSEWKAARQRIHIAWKTVSSKARWIRPLHLALDGDSFFFDRGRVRFRTLNLLTFAALEVATVPSEKLRRCANFLYGCETPFFFASDLRERYCSQTCANTAKKRSKLNWWNGNRKVGTDGTQKAR